MAETITLAVTGMTCDHCVSAVTGAIKSVEGVSDAKVSLDEKSAVLQGQNVDLQKVIDAIAEEGYEAALA